MWFMNVLLVEDHPLIRMGLEILIKGIYPNAQVIHATNFEQAIEMLKSQGFDFIILDIVIPGSKSVAMVKEIREVQPAVSILIHTAHDEQLYGLTYIRAGADGFISKNSVPDQIKVAIKVIAEKGKYLSPELRASLVEKLASKQTDAENNLQRLSPIEMRVAQLLVEGYWNKEIAAFLNLRSSTVSTYKQRIFSKLGVKDVIQLAKLVNTLQE
jgi:DNA-binding NarL/FixJ family response regulator